jgi:hypothetical protein
MLKVINRETKIELFTVSSLSLIPKGAFKVSEGVYEIDYIVPATTEETVKPRASIPIPFFKALFTLSERVAIAGSADVGVKLLWADIEDPRTTEIHLDLPYVIEGVTHLETVACIGEGRASEILRLPV